MKIGQAPENLEKYGTDPDRISEERLYARTQRSPIDQLHRIPRGTGIDSRIVDRHDVGVFKIIENRSFAGKSLAHLDCTFVSVTKGLHGRG